MSAASKTYRQPSEHAKNGFILLEVLIAMSLMMGAWVTLIQSYQTLSLKFVRQEQERVKLIKEWNESELSLFGKAVSNVSSRMSGKPRTLHAAAQPTSQNQR